MLIGITEQERFQSPRGTHMHSGRATMAAAAWPLQHSSVWEGSGQSCQQQPQQHRVLSLGTHCAACASFTPLRAPTRARLSPYWQTCRHSSMVRKLLAFPLRPPYTNSQHDLKAGL